VGKKNDEKKGGHCRPYNQRRKEGRELRPEDDRDKLCARDSLRGKKGSDLATIVKVKMQKEVFFFPGRKEGRAGDLRSRKYRDFLGRKVAARGLLSYS